MRALSRATIMSVITVLGFAGRASAIEVTPHANEGARVLQFTLNEMSAPPCPTTAIFVKDAGGGGDDIVLDVGFERMNPR